MLIKSLIITGIIKHSINDLYEEENDNCAWYEKQMEPYPKGIGYWYNPKRPKTKYSKLENAPKANPPTQRSQNSHGGHIAQAQDVDGEPENDDEINITQSETCRMKILTINVRSAVSDRKKSQIRAGIKRIYPDVVVITESWFGDRD